MCCTDNDCTQIYPTLVAVLKASARKSLLWETVLRALIWRGADLHAPVRRDPKDMDEFDYSRLMAEYGTALYEL